MGLGEAAGTAVALAHRSGARLHDIPGEAIRRELGKARVASGAPPLDACLAFARKPEDSVSPLSA
jgi:hypothetical protein